MAGFDNPSVYGANRHLENPFTLDTAKLVTLALKGWQFGFEIKVLSQWVDFGPVIVQRTPAWIRVPFKFEPEQILNLALLPIDGGERIGQRKELRLLHGDRHAEDEKTVSRIQREHII